MASVTRERLEKELNFTEDVGLNYQVKSPNCDWEGNDKVHAGGLLLRGRASGGGQGFIDGLFSKQPKSRNGEKGERNWGGEGRQLGVG